MVHPFLPFRIGSLTFKNRFVRSATHDDFGLSDGRMSDREISLLSELAKGDVALLFSAITAISEEGVSETLQNRLDHDEHIEPLRKAIAAVHVFDAKYVVQLAHGGYKSRLERPWGPMSIPLQGGRTSRAMTKVEIEKVCRDFALSAKRAMLAGADGVQIHAAHGYLLTQFISPIENKRDDDYGGNALKRFRIVKEIIESIQDECGFDFPIFLKINANLVRGNADFAGENLAYFEDLVQMCDQSKQLNICAIELGGTGYPLLESSSRPFFLQQAARLRQQVDLPLILVGGIQTQKEVETALSEGIDMVSMSRPFICEPDLVVRFRNQQAKSSCIACNQCFSLPKQDGRRCILHPR